MTKTKDQTIDFQKLVIERATNNLSVDGLFLGDDSTTRVALDFDAIYDVKLPNGTVYEVCTLWRRGLVEPVDASEPVHKEMRRFRTAENLPNDLDDVGLQFKLNPKATQEKKLSEVDTKLKPLYQQRIKLAQKIKVLESQRANCG